MVKGLWLRGSEGVAGVGSSLWCSRSDSLYHMCNQGSPVHSVSNLCLQQLYLRVEEVKCVFAVNSSLLDLRPESPRFLVTVKCFLLGFL